MLCRMPRACQVWNRNICILNIFVFFITRENNDNRLLLLIYKVFIYLFFLNKDFLKLKYHFLYKVIIIII